MTLTEDSFLKLNWRVISSVKWCPWARFFLFLAHPLPPYIFKILKHFKMVIISPKGFNTVVMLD